MPPTVQGNIRYLFMPYLVPVHDSGWSTIWSSLSGTEQSRVCKCGFHPS